MPVTAITAKLIQANSDSKAYLSDRVHVLVGLGLLGLRLIVQKESQFVY
jgi:hypothetical protein